MTLLISLLKKAVNDFSIKQIFGILFVLHCFLLLCGYFLIGRPLVLELSRGEKNKKMLLVGAVVQELPKQNFHAQKVSDLYQEIAKILQENKFLNYGLQKTEILAYKKQCFSGFEIKAEDSFKNCMLLLRILSKRAIFVKSLAIEKSEHGKVFFDLGLMGFCGEYCACDTESS